MDQSRRLTTRWISACVIAILIAMVGVGPFSSSVQAGCLGHSSWLPQALQSNDPMALLDFQSLSTTDSGPTSVTPLRKPCRGWLCSDQSKPLSTSVAGVTLFFVDVMDCFGFGSTNNLSQHLRRVNEPTPHPIHQSQSLERPPRQES